MIPIIVLLSGYALAAWALHAVVRRHGDVQFSIWHILTIFVVARLASRAVAWLAPELDLYTRLGIGFGMYVAVVSVALGAWGRVPWGRSIAWGVVVAALMFAGGIAAVAFLPSPAPAGTPTP